MQVTVNREQVIFSVSAKWSAPPRASKRLRVSQRRELGRALDRTQVRKPAYLHSSISHTHHVGGFAVARCPVGIDLEPAKRKISVAAMRWFASLAEINRVADPLYIWVMKEAAYKAFKGPRQPPTVRDIVIFRVKASQNKTLRFSFRLKKRRSHSAATGAGLVKINSRTIMGIAVVTP